MSDLARPEVILTNHAIDRAALRGVEVASLEAMLREPLLKGRAAKGDARYEEGAVSWASGPVISGAKRHWLTAVYVIDRGSKIVLTCYFGPPGERTTLRCLRDAPLAKEAV